MPIPSLQHPHGPSHRKPPTVPTNTRNITRVFRLAPRSLLIRCSPNQGRLHPYRGELSGLQLRLSLTRPTTLTWAETWQGACRQGRHRSLPRSQGHMRNFCRLSSPTIWPWWSRERSTIPHSQNGITLARPAHTMGGPGPLDRIVLGPKRQGPKLDRGRVVDLSRGRAQHKNQPACQSWKGGG